MRGQCSGEEVEGHDKIGVSQKRCWGEIVEVQITAFIWQNKGNLGVLRRLNLCYWRIHPSGWNLSRLVIGGAEEAGKYCREGDGGVIREPDLAKLEVLGCRSALSGPGGRSGKAFCNVSGTIEWSTMTSILSNLATDTSIG